MNGLLLDAVGAPKAAWDFLIMSFFLSPFIFGFLIVAFFKLLDKFSKKE